MEKKQIETIVNEAIGTASMAWTEPPQGAFNETLASECAVRIMVAIDHITTENTALRQALEEIIVIVNNAKEPHFIALADILEVTQVLNK